MPATLALSTQHKQTYHSYSRPSVAELTPLSVIKASLFSHMAAMKHGTFLFSSSALLLMFMNLFLFFMSHRLEIIGK